MIDITPQEFKLITDNVFINATSKLTPEQRNKVVKLATELETTLRAHITENGGEYTTGVLFTALLIHLKVVMHLGLEDPS